MSAKPMRAVAGAALVAAGVALAGCSDATPSSNADTAYLTASLGEQTTLTQRDNLLPLKKGNVWQMRSSSQGRRSDDAITVIGPTQVGGLPTTEVEVRRFGAKWRREFYTDNASGLYLAAMQDETSPVMPLKPPLALINYPAHEGSTVDWSGTITLSGVEYPATAYSRVSAQEPVTTAAGKFKTVRIDTVIVMNSNGREIRFPSVRWMAPSVGFVRRGFADRGLPAFSEMVEFNVH